MNTKDMLNIVQWSGHYPQLNIKLLMLQVLKLRNLVVSGSCHCCCNSDHHYRTIKYAIMYLSLYWAIIQVILCAKQALYD
jgi:hypothetical protein